MFGYNVSQILQGWTNDMLGKEQELYDKRMPICKQCPLYNSKNDRCDASKCLDVKQNKLVSGPGEGIICGCNCYCAKKVRVPNAKCVLKKW